MQPISPEEVQALQARAVADRQRSGQPQESGAYQAQAPEGNFNQADAAYAASQPPTVPQMPAMAAPPQAQPQPMPQALPQAALYPDPGAPAPVHLQPVPPPAAPPAAPAAYPPYGQQQPQPLPQAPQQAPAGFGARGYQQQSATEFVEQPVELLDPTARAYYACTVMAQLVQMLKQKNVPMGAYMMARVNDYLGACGYQRLR